MRYVLTLPLYHDMIDSMNTIQRHIDEMMTDDTVFITPVGSRLYGLEKPDSDYDYFIIRDRKMRKSTHSIKDEYDLRIFNPILFYEMLMRKPTHTGLEALYSPLREFGPAAAKWMPFLDAFRPGLPALRQTFLSASIGTLNVRDDVKFKRFRLGLHLADSYAYAYAHDGYYNPRLSPARAAELTARAERLFNASEEERYQTLLDAFGEPEE